MTISTEPGMSSGAIPPSIDMHADIPPSPQAGWQALPARARSLFMLTDALRFASAAALGFAVLAAVFEFTTPGAAAAVGLLLGAGLGAITGARRHRRTHWLADANGFAFARGNWWRHETRVPASRVQHIDLKHGPLERRWKLATLVIHTAGSKFSAVSASGLDAGNAESLRDRLARQLDADDDAL